MEHPRPARPSQPIEELYWAGEDEFGSGLSAAIERHHRDDWTASAGDGRPKKRVEPNYDRLALLAAPAAPAPLADDVDEAEAAHDGTRGLVELAVGVVGALMVFDGLWAWQRRRA